MCNGCCELLRHERGGRVARRRGFSAPGFLRHKSTRVKTSFMRTNCTNVFVLLDLSLFALRMCGLLDAPRFQAVRAGGCFSSTVAISYRTTAHLQNVLAPTPQHVLYERLEIYVCSPLYQQEHALLK